MEERSERDDANELDVASATHDRVVDRVIDPEVEPGPDLALNPVADPIDAPSAHEATIAMSSPFDETIDDTPAPDADPDVRALRRRDRAFVFRVALRAGVALLLGIWIFLQLTSTDVGACAARGFGTVTG